MVKNSLSETSDKEKGVCETKQKPSDFLELSHNASEACDKVNHPLSSKLYSTFDARQIFASLNR